MSFWNRGEWVVARECAAKASFTSLLEGEWLDEGTVIVEQNDKTRKFRAYFEDTRGKRMSISASYALRFIRKYEELVKE